MDLLDAMVYLLVFCIAVLFPLAGWLWEYVRPWVKELLRDLADLAEMRGNRRTERRVKKKLAAYNRWKETRRWTV